MRRARTIADLTQDPGFPFHVGQLTGACEMTAWILTGSDDEEMKRLGVKLAEAADWFFHSDTKEGFGWTDKT